MLEIPLAGSSSALEGGEPKIVLIGQLPSRTHTRTPFSKHTQTDRQAHQRTSCRRPAVKIWGKNSFQVCVCVSASGKKQRRVKSQGEESVNEQERPRLATGIWHSQCLSTFAPQLHAFWAAIRALSLCVCVCVCVWLIDLWLAASGVCVCVCVRNSVMSTRSSRSSSSYWRRGRREERRASCQEERHSHWAGEL